MPGYVFEIVVEEEWEDVFVDATWKSVDIFYELNKIRMHFRLKN